jgi:DNA-binding MarR family transcriptional regulator
MGHKATQLFLSNQLCFPLYAASRLTTKLYTPYLEELGITYPQYLVMLTLWQHEHLTVKEIGEKLFLESNTLTPLLKRLEQKELIKRTRSKMDERTVEISLTAQGEELKEEAKHIPEKIAESFGEIAIDKEGLDELRTTLFGLLDTLNSKG